MGNKESNMLYRVQFKIYSFVLFLLTMIGLVAFKDIPEVQVAIVRVMVSFLVIILPILIFESILMSKRLTTSLLLISGLIILTGVIFFKMWPLKEYSDIAMIFPLLLLIVVHLRDFYKIITLSSGGSLKMGSIKIKHLDELIGYGLKVKPFREMLILEAWMLLLGAVSHMLVIMYSSEEMAGLYVLLFYLICLIIFPLSNLISILYITKKVKKSATSIIGFAITTIISVPLCILYFLVLLSVSAKLMG